MPADRSIWKRKGRPNWYTKVQGQQVNLGTPDRKEALRALRAIERRLELEEDARAEPKTPGTDYVAGLLDRFLDSLDAEGGGKKYSWYRTWIESFAAAVGPHLLIADLKPLHVSQWIEANADRWNSTTRAGAITAVKRAFNWCEEQGIILRSPIAKVRKPRRKRREFLFEPWQVMLLISACPDHLAPLVALSASTGARPSDLRRATGRMVSRDGATINLGSRHKTKTVARVVYVPTYHRRMVLRLAAAAKDGPLFPTERGRHWSLQHLSKHVAEARKAARLPDAADHYALRHYWITHRVVDGIPLAYVAELAGTSIEMISKNYAHLQASHLRKVADAMG